MTRNQKGIVFLPILVIILVLGVAGYFVYQNYELKQQASQIRPISQPKVTETPAPTASATKTDSLEGWVTYLNTSANYSIEYPPTWEAENYGVMDSKPAEPDTKYVRIYYQPDVSKVAISLEIEEASTIPTSQETKLDKEKIIGIELSKCWTTGDSITTLCWLKVPNKQKYLNIHVINYNNLEDNKTIEQILSTFNFTKYTTKEECQLETKRGCECMVTKLDTESSNPFCIDWQPTK